MQGTSTNNKQYDYVEFIPENNGTKAVYYNDDIISGTRQVSTDIQKNVISEWHTDVSGNRSVITDSLWRNSGNDPFWPNYTKSVYMFEEKLNTGFSDQFTLSGYSNIIENINSPSGVNYKQYNQYALNFRIKASNVNLKVEFNNKTTIIKISGQADTYITIPSTYVSGGSSIKFINSSSVNATIYNVSYSAVNETFLAKRISNEMYAYHTYQSISKSLDTTITTEYRVDQNVESVVERKNTNNSIIKNLSYEYDTASKPGKLNKIEGTEHGKSVLTEITRNEDEESNREEITTTVKDGKRTTSSVIFNSGTQEHTHTITDSNGITTIKKYKLNNGDIRLKEVYRDNENIFYEYDTDGNITRITSKDFYDNIILDQNIGYQNGNINQTELGDNSYDISYNNYLLVSGIHSNSVNLIEYQYNQNGYLSELNYANGNYANFAYLNKTLQNISYYDYMGDTLPDVIEYQTDQYGRTEEITQKEGQTAVLSYDFGDLDNKNKKTIEISGINGYNSYYEYNIDADKQRLTNESHNINYNNYNTYYNYDNKDMLSQIQTGAYKTEITYDSLNRIDSATIKYNNIAIFDNHYEYQSKIINEYYSTTSLLTRKSDYIHYGGSSSYYLNPYVNYNSNGMISNIYNGNSTIINSYTYDDSGRLNTETVDGQYKTYNYNENNDIESIISSGYYNNKYYYYDSNNRLSDFSNGVDYYNFNYDNMGNPTIYKGGSTQNMYWTRGRMLASGNQQGNSFEYKYDADNLRYQKTVNGETTQYYYNGNNITAELRDIDGLPVFVYYLYGIDGVVGMVYNGTYYFYEKNVLGDIISILNSSGARVATYDYDAWGNIIDQTGSMADINPFRYRGYYQDDELSFT